MSRKLSRREFLRLSTVATVGAVVAACATPPAPTAVPPTAVPPPTAPTAVPPTAAPVATTAPLATPVPQPTAVPAAKYKEAPVLADLVKAGKLPPVDQRLPKNPWVVASYEGQGKYGGMWRRAFSGVSDGWGANKLVDRGWAWFDKSLNLQPHLLESWDTNKDGTVWTIKLREGLRWSDGVEHTSADYEWWYKNELTNKKVTPGVESKWTNPDKSVVQLEVVDKYTVKFTYKKPKPMFIYNMTRSAQGTPWGAGPITPSHYMKKWHIDTTDDKAALEAAVKKDGSPSWEKFYVDKLQWWYLNPARPHFGGWFAKAGMGTELFEMERNPYFFGVDPQGNQLPYIDKITHRLFQSPELKNLWVTNGEIDMQARHMTISDLALYKASEAKGDFKTVMAISATHVGGLNLNLTTKNKLLNEFFNQRNVRIAISHAINREQINQLVFNGMLKPRQYSPLPMSPQYHEKLSNAFIKYDPDLANKLLDEAGYTKKDANGIRLHKDGTTPISFTIEGIDAAGTPTEDAALLTSKDLAKVGIKMIYKYVERALYTQHYDANDLEAGWWGGDRTVVPIVAEAPIFRGIYRDRPWCPGWSWYYSDPNNPNAVKPPEGHWIYNIWKIWDEEVAVEPDPAKQTAAFKKILDIWATELPVVTLLGESPAPTIVKNGFKGYPAGMPNDDTTGDEQFCNSETYYWDDPSKHMG